jgi:ABC-type branched-subunit amino acid transport system permease subunit
VAAVFGIILGAPTLRLRGDYLAIVTLGFGEIVPRVFRNLSTWTSGVNGISALDPPVLPLWVNGPWAGLPLAIERDVQMIDPTQFYVLMVFLLTGVIILVNNLYRSRIGRAWMAIREDEGAAASMGINTVTTKLLAFAIGASFSGFAGCFYGAKLSLVSPDSFSFVVSVTILLTGVIILVNNLHRSRMGRAWMAIREDEGAAASMGINTVTTKLLAFAIGASFSGFAGCFYGAKLSLVSPDSFSFVVSVTILLMVVLGGMGNIPGVIVGALTIYVIDFYVLTNLANWLSALANLVGLGGLNQQNGAWPRTSTPGTSAGSRPASASTITKPVAPS